MAIIGIVAVDRNGAIGRGGQLPWHYPADLKFFKAQTTGHACLMGYRTWLSLKRALPNRLNIVLTRRAEVEGRESVVWLRDKGSALSLYGYLNCDLFVIGGAQIFEMFRGRAATSATASRSPSTSARAGQNSRSPRNRIR